MRTHTPPDSKIDHAQAKLQLDVIGGADLPQIFVAIPDTGDGRPVHLFGRFCEVVDKLDAFQRRGYGVHVTVNAMKGQRRRKSDVLIARAVWAERDEPGRALPLRPSLRIRTSTGRGHEYLAVDPADPLNPADAERINRLIATEYGADPQACDVARCLRLAGSWHLKRQPCRVEIIGGAGRTYSARELLSAFPAPPPKPFTPMPRIEVADRYLAATLRGVVAEITNAPNGRRNGTLNRAAFRLATLGLDAQHIAHVLVEPARQIGLATHEISATIRSGARAGAAAAMGGAHG